MKITLKKELTDQISQLRDQINKSVERYPFMNNDPARRLFIGFAFAKFNIQHPHEDTRLYCATCGEPTFGDDKVVLDYNDECPECAKKRPVRPLLDQIEQERRKLALMEFFRQIKMR